MAGLLWSEGEIRACVECYAEMWRADRTARQVNKADHVRALLQGPLRKRTKGAIEYRFANISAVMVEAGAPFLPGYVPAANVGPTNAKLIRAMLVEQGLLC